MKKFLAYLCIPLMILSVFTKGLSLQAKETTPYSQDTNEICYLGGGCNYVGNSCATTDYVPNECDACGDDSCCRECGGGYGCCLCPVGGPYKWADNPCAALCGTRCGVSYYSMGLALALVVGVAVVVLSNGEGFHAHPPFVDY